MARPRALPGLGAVSRHPDHLADVRVASEDAVAKRLGLVDRALIEVEPHRAGRRQEPPDDPDALFEPRQVHVERWPPVVVGDWPRRPRSRALRPCAEGDPDRKRWVEVRELGGPWRHVAPEIARIAVDEDHQNAETGAVA